MVAREGEWRERDRAQFWQFVRGRMAERRLSQTELARRLHLDRSVLSRRLNEQILERPPATMVDQLVAALQLSAADADQLRALAGYGPAMAPAATEAQPLAESAAMPSVEITTPFTSAPLARRRGWQPLMIGVALLIVTVSAGAAGFMLARWLPPTVSSAPPPGGPVALRDDFSDAASGWPVGREPAYGWERAYADGEYLLASEPGFRGVARANRTDLLLRNTQIEVDARLPDSSPKVGVFIGVRLDATGYMRFEVWPDYQFCVFTRMNGVRDDLIFTRLVYRSDYHAIRAGTAVNRIGVRALGSTFIGLVNGEESLRVEDNSLLEGGIVLGAVSTTSDIAIAARFDNLVITPIITVR